MQLDELAEIMLEVAMNRSPTVKIGRDAEYPTGFVQQRFEKITSMPVSYTHLDVYKRQVLISHEIRTFSVLFCPITYLPVLLTQTLTPTGAKLYPRKWTRDLDPWPRSADTHLTHRVRSAAPVLL